MPKNNKTRLPKEKLRRIEGYQKHYQRTLSDLNEKLDFMPEDVRQAMADEDQLHFEQMPSSDPVAVKPFHDAAMAANTERQTQYEKLLAAQQKSELAELTEQGGAPDQKEAIEARHKTEKAQLADFFAARAEANEAFARKLNWEHHSSGIISETKAGLAPGEVGAVALNQQGQNGKIQAYKLPVCWEGLNHEMTGLKLDRYQTNKRNLGDNFLAAKVPYWGMKWLDRLVGRGPAEVVYHYNPKTHAITMPRSVYAQLGKRSDYREKLLNEALKKGSVEDRFQAVLDLSQNSSGLMGTREAFWASQAKRYLENGHEPQQLMKGMTLEEVLEGAEGLLIHGKGMMPLDTLFEELNGGTLVCTNPTTGQPAPIGIIDSKLKGRIDRLNRLRDTMKGLTQEKRSELTGYHGRTVESTNELMDQRVAVAEARAEVHNQAVSLKNNVANLAQQREALAEKYNGASASADNKAAFEELSPLAADGSPKDSTDFSEPGSLTQLESVTKAAAESYAEQFSEIHSGREHAKSIIEESKKALASIEQLEDVPVEKMQELQARVLNSLHSAVGALEKLDKEAAALQQRQDRLLAVADKHQLAASLKEQLDSLKSKSHEASKPEYDGLVSKTRNYGQQVAAEAQSFAKENQAAIEEGIANGRQPIKLREVSDFEPSPQIQPPRVG